MLPNPYRHWSAGVRTGIWGSRSAHAAQARGWNRSRGVGGAVAEHGPEDVESATGQGEHCLDVGFAFGAFAVVEGPAVGRAERGEGGLIEETLKCLVAGIGAPDGARLARLPENGGEACGGGEPVGGAYVRLLDSSGEFTAEVPTSATGHFRFFAHDGRWTLRTLAPGAKADRTVVAAVGRVAEVDVELTAA